MLETRVSTLMAKLEKKPAFEYALLAVIVLFAAVLRFYKLGEWSLWIDEIFTINRAQIHFGDPLGVLMRLPQTLWLPPSFILTSIFLNIFGVSEWSARLASNLIGIVSIPVLYLFVRKVWGSWVALIFALLLAASPWHLFWSQNARFYSSLMLLYGLIAILFFLAIEKDHPSYFIPFYILFYFALSERLFAAFIFPTIVIYLACVWLFRFERPPGLRMRNLLIFFAPVVLMAVVDLIRFALTGNSIASDFVNVFGAQQFDDPARLMVAILYNIGFAVMALSAITGLYLVLKRSRSGLFLVLAAGLPVVLLLVMNPFAFTKDRYAFQTLPFWLILVAISVKEAVSHSRGLGRLLAAGLLVVFLADSAGGILQYYLVNHGNRRDWRAAFALVQERSRPEDAVVTWWPEFSPFYLGGREVLPYQDVTVKEIMQSGRRYWFVVDSETEWGNQKIQYWLKQNAQLIDILYLRAPEDDFHLRVYFFDSSAPLTGK